MKETFLKKYSQGKYSPPSCFNLPTELGGFWGAWLLTLPMGQPQAVTRLRTEPAGSHLPLREPQRGSQLSFPPDGDVATVVKLLLQLQPLVIRVHDSVFVFCPGFHCGGRRR